MSLEEVSPLESLALSRLGYHSSSDYCCFGGHFVVDPLLQGVSGSALPVDVVSFILGRSANPIVAPI